MATPTPDANEPGRRIVLVQSSRVSSVDMLRAAVTTAMVVNQLVREVLADIPDADFIEVRAIKYKPEEGKSERDISDPPAGQ